MHDTAVFWSAVMTLLTMPGPTNTLLAIAGAMKGVRKALPLVAAEAAGYTIAIFSLVMLLDPILAALPVLRTIIRLVAAAYLLVVAIRLWRFKREVARDQVVGASRLFFATLTNPKAMIIALLMQPFGESRLGLLFLILIGSVLIMGSLWILVGASIGRATSTVSQSHVLPQFGAIVVTLFAVLLLISTLADVPIRSFDGARPSHHPTAALSHLTKGDSNVRNG